MDSFGPEAITEFLRLVDAELASPCTVTLIGGCVVGLSYQSEYATSDIDHVPTTQRAFHEAVVRAQAKLPIVVQSVGIFTAPYSYEDRLTRLGLEGLTRLTLLVPEAHDLSIMKIARGDASDLDAVEAIHAKVGLSRETLVERYRESLTQVIGPLSQFRDSFLAAIARLFGEEAAVALERGLGS